jgi:hypothetical protein
MSVAAFITLSFPVDDGDLLMRMVAIGPQTMRMIAIAQGP